MSSLGVGEPLNHPPEVLDHRAVVFVAARVVGVLPEVVDVDGHRCARDQDLELLVVEHAEPVEVDDVG